MIVGLRLVAERRTEVKRRNEDARFFLGKVDAPVAILQYKDIPDYLDAEFWSAYQIWNNSRLTNSLPCDQVWGRNPEFLIEIITTFQTEYEKIIGGS